MVNFSPPSISLPGVHDDKRYSSASHIPIASSGASISPIASFGDSNQHIISPQNSSLLEPQALSGDVFNLSSEFPSENDFHSGSLEAHDPVQLSSSFLSTHSATGAGSAGSNSGRRARSGSLFSTHSIWNDDILPNNSPDRSASNGPMLDLFPDSTIPGSSSSRPSSFISPNLLPQASPFGYATQSRNRSHTTSGSVNGPGIQKMETFRSNLSPLLHSTQDDQFPVFDNFYLNSNENPTQGTRNRSQTYSGVQPKVSNAVLPNIIPGTNSQSASQNLPNFQSGAMHHNIQRSQPVHESSLIFTNSNAEPFLQDDFNFFDLSITTNFENPSLGPTNTLLLDNIPPFLDASKLYQLLSNPTGMLSGSHNRGVLSVRMASTNNSKMALVVCPSVEVAMSLKASFNHLELVPGAIIYVAFAAVMEKSKTETTIAIPKLSQVLAQKDFSHTDSSKSSSKKSFDSVSRKSSTGSTSDSEFPLISDSVLTTCSRLSGPLQIDFQKISSIIDNAAKFPKSEYKTSFGSLPEPSTSRQFDAPKIRELRKSLEANEKALQKSQTPDSDGDPKLLSQSEIESLALAMLDELPELCYDHIGNTIVQKIFTFLESSSIKLKMVKKILPYFAQLGIHKNGTWAIQKIINSSQGEPQQKLLIAEGIRPYSAKLFNDQFGNYVLQCCLKFETPYNDFIFETICNNFLEISSGRFGVRCIRTILETVNDCKSGVKGPVSREQLVLVFALIVEYANELVVNSNGSLLITWFLDTFHGLKNSIPDPRIGLLCERLMPNLDKLCTHKLANVTIFRLLNNRTDLGVRQRILDAIFLPFNDSEYDQSRPPTHLLESILKETNDNSAGPIFMQKLISSPNLFAIGDEYVNQRYQHFAVNQVKRVLLEMHIANLQPYKKLLDEVGLSNGRISRANSSNRKGKRGSGNGRNGPPHSSYHHVMPNYPHISMGQHMPMPIGYGNVVNEHQVYYAPFVPGIGNPVMPMNGTQPVFNTQYFEKTSAVGAGSSEPQYNQDAHVMRQLEQLSLQSAAMGYASNPGTPSANMGNPSQNSFF
ncbi:hypothetical protein JCM33374_g1710 [Metschnikowia sp. JCM 33374]|nr:hypothetical protein JCM33374_g1710 [Metschnikowia sp. JCM 33374]